MQKHLKRWHAWMRFSALFTALAAGLPNTSALAANHTISTISAKCQSETPASMNVVGTVSGGNVFGNPSGGYSTDSDLNVAAVHAGLVAPGASAYIAVTPLDTVNGFTGTTANGVTTRSYANAWCGMRLAVSTPSGKPLPTVKVQYNMSPLVANSSFTMNWTTTNATLLERVCTAAAGGFVSPKQSMSLDSSGNGSLNGTASPAWVGKPSNCIWTVTGPGGSVDLQETRTTVSDVPTIPPNTLPTISVQHTPAPMIAGQNFTLRWSTTNALDVTLECTSATGKGFIFAKTSMGGVNDSTSTTALASWIGNPSTCTWTATNSYGNKTVTETWTTVASTTPEPTIAVQYSAMPLLAGSEFTLNWKTTNATSLTRVCTADGTGFNSQKQAMALPESSLNSTANSGWIGYPSTCTWVATGPGGSKTLTEIRTTVATLPPQLTVQYTPATLIAGQSFSLNWSSNNTKTVAYDCKSASGSGSFSGQGGATGTVNRTADASWVASPLVCSWRADGDGGSKYQSDTLTTSAAKETVTFFHNDVAGTPLMASDVSGNVVWKENYLPYGGKLTNQASSKDNSVGYAGSPFDSNTGLSYMGARYYDPAIGRFMGIDPVGVDIANLHSVNRYTYANNNPYKFIDPDGREFRFADGSSDQFKADVAQMRAYLGMFNADASLKFIDSSETVITLRESYGTNQMHLTGYTIVIDPKSALKVDSGMVQTPALGFLHEAAHAEQKIKDAEGFANDAGRRDAVYDTKEEKRVIQNIEGPAADMLREPRRFNHGGMPIQVECSTCIK